MAWCSSPATRKPAAEGTDWRALAATARDAKLTLVIYMGVGGAERIQDELLSGLPATTPVAVVQRASLPDQRQCRHDAGRPARDHRARTACQPGRDRGRRRGQRRRGGDRRWRAGSARLRARLLHSGRGLRASAYTRAHAIRCGGHRRGRGRPVLRRCGRPARAEGAADRPQRKSGREDPHLRRRPLQLHQPRLDPRARTSTSSARTRTSAARPCRATRRTTSSPWCSATASPSTKSTRASCFATARPRTSSRCCWRMRGRRRHALAALRGPRGECRFRPGTHAAGARYELATDRGSVRARARGHRHRRPVDPEDRRHRFRLSHRPPVRPAHRASPARRWCR